MRRKEADERTETENTLCYENEQLHYKMLVIFFPFYKEHQSVHEGNLDFLGET